MPIQRGHGVLSGLIAGTAAFAIDACIEGDHIGCARNHHRGIQRAANPALQTREAVGTFYGFQDLGRLDHQGERIDLGGLHVASPA